MGPIKLFISFQHQIQFTLFLKTFAMFLNYSSGRDGSGEEMDFETVHNIDEWGAESVSVRLSILEFLE